MKDLIEQLEKATGPDRGLDVAIWATFADPKKYRRVETMPRYSDWDSYHSGNWQPFYPSLNAEKYTASLDAALTLAPSGDGDKELYFGGTEDCLAQFEAPPGRFNQGRHKSLPIAICIAAFRARLTATN